jgi:hypothetical protein
VKPQCPVCESDKVLIERDALRGDTNYVRCAQCGSYRISGTAEATLRIYKAQLYKLSGVLRNASENGHELEVRSDNIDELISRAPATFSISNLIDRILLLVADRTMGAETFRKAILLYAEDFPLFNFKSAEDYFYIVGKLKELDLLDIEAAMGPNVPVLLTVSGWERVDRLQSARGKPDQAFVAMWFDKPLDEAYSKGIEPALRATGFAPLRIDRLPHNERIDDKILAEIRRSGLVLADFTGQRQGVYFEAGFGLGLNIPVIWSCRQDWLEKGHFDTRQYNHIVWTDPSDLREQLEARIKALGFART